MAKARPRDRDERGGKGGGRARRGVAGLALTRRQRRRLGVGRRRAGRAAWSGSPAAGSSARARGPVPGEFVREPRQRPHPDGRDAAPALQLDPPTSGPHLPYIAPWGVHTRPIPKELQVHNLEDGGVVVNYRPKCADQVLGRLKAIVDRYPDHVVLAPYPGLDRCIALTAWTRIDKLDELDERRIVRFIEAYRGIDHHPR